MNRRISSLPSERSSTYLPLKTQKTQVKTGAFSKQDWIFIHGERKDASCRCGPQGIATLLREIDVRPRRPALSPRVTLCCPGLRFSRQTYFSSFIYIRHPNRASLQHKCPIRSQQSALMQKAHVRPPEVAVCYDFVQVVIKPRQ